MPMRVKRKTVDKQQICSRDSDCSKPAVSKDAVDPALSTLDCCVYAVIHALRKSPSVTVIAAATTG